MSYFKEEIESFLKDKETIRELKKQNKELKEEIEELRNETKCCFVGGCTKRFSRCTFCDDILCDQHIAPCPNCNKNVCENCRDECDFCPLKGCLCCIPMRPCDMSLNSCEECFKERLESKN